MPPFVSKLYLGVTSTVVVGVQAYPNSELHHCRYGSMHENLRATLALYHQDLMTNAVHGCGQSNWGQK